MATSKNEVIEIKPIKIEKVNVTIVGDTPLIVHAWSEKAKREMLEKQMKVTKSKGKDAKNPVEDFISSMYWLSGKPTEYTQEAFEDAIESGATFGFPTNAIKQAAISGAFRSGALKDKVSSKGTFFIEGVEFEGNQFAVIKSDAPIMREDMVRIGMGTADIRYRGEFRNWSMDLIISYNANGQQTLEQVINMLNIGGYTVGIGEWRPEKDGQNGMFHVEAK
jgi:hypothetical protein